MYFSPFPSPRRSPTWEIQMTWSYLMPGGNPVLSFLLYKSVKGALRTRDRYADMKCPKCGKLDELSAIRRGIDDGIKLKTQRDFFPNGDWLCCVSARFQQVYKEEQFTGLDFVEVPGAHGTAVVAPLRRVKTDPARSGMKFLGSPCEICGRHRETLRFPEIAAMDLPPDEPKGILMPDLLPDKSNGHMFAPVAAEGAIEILKRNKITGIDWAAS